jgi:phage terminase large subunit-like protein
MTEDSLTQTNLLESFFVNLMNLSPAERNQFLMERTQAVRERLSKTWWKFGLLHQRAPLLARNGMPWTTWLILGGRGAGKTRAGAEWVRAEALDPSARIALIGETARDVRDVMIEGVSGLIAVHERRFAPEWVSSRNRLEFQSGAIAECSRREASAERVRAISCSSASGSLNPLCPKTLIPLSRYGL